jgi:hypothetical protein
VAAPSRSIVLGDLLVSGLHGGNKEDLSIWMGLKWCLKREGKREGGRGGRVGETCDQEKCKGGDRMLVKEIF